VTVGRRQQYATAAATAGGPGTPGDDRRQDRSAQRRPAENASACASHAQPDVLLLNEPTSHLDVAHRLDLLKLVGGLRLTTLAALHDLNLAAMFCGDFAVISAGRIVAADPRPTCSPQSSSPTSTTRNASSRRTPSPHTAYHRHPTPRQLS
jgi:iron complex transport system ATP-binding protein